MQAFLGPTQLYKYKAQIVGRNRFRESNLLARRVKLSLCYCGGWLGVTENCKNLLSSI